MNRGKLQRAVVNSEYFGLGVEKTRSTMIVLQIHKAQMF